MPPSVARRGPCGGVRRHPAANVLVGKHRQVRVKLFIEVGLEWSRRKPASDAGGQHKQPCPHGQRSNLSTRPMTPDTRLPVCGLCGELAASRASEGVELGPPVVLGCAPRRGRSTSAAAAAPGTGRSSPGSPAARSRRSARCGARCRSRACGPSRRGSSAPSNRRALQNLGLVLPMRLLWPTHMNMAHLLWDVKRSASGQQVGRLQIELSTIEPLRAATVRSRVAWSAGELGLAERSAAIARPKKCGATRGARSAWSRTE